MNRLLLQLLKLLRNRLLSIAIRIGEYIVMEMRVYFVAYFHYACRNVVQRFLIKQQLAFLFLSVVESVEI